MAATPQINLRFRPAEQHLLDAIAADMGRNRTDAVRALIHQEAERRGLVEPSAAAFLAKLGTAYGPSADLHVVLDGGAVAKATIAGRPGDDFNVEVVHDSGGRAEVLLEDPSGAASVLVTGVIRPRPGLELTVNVPIAYLLEGSQA